MSGGFPLPQLVAHRGARADRPENTVLAVEAAIAAGVTSVEIDVQMSADGVPIVIHDPVLMRTTGRRGCVARMQAAAIERISAHEPGRFSEKYHPQPIARLSTLVARLNRRPPQRLFVELKQHGLRAAGVEATLAAVKMDLANACFEWVLISFDPVAIATVADSAKGWVLPAWNQAALNQARSIAPDYLFVNADRVGADALWSGDWQWVVYEVGDWPGVCSWLKRGAALVETDSALRLAAEARCRATSNS